MIGVEEDEPMEVSVLLTSHWVTMANPLSTFENCNRNR